MDASTPSEEPPGEIEERGVFVPAIMSVGLVFSIATLVRDALGWMGGRAHERRTAIEARTVVGDLLGEEPFEPADLGILSRWEYLLSALALLGAATWVTIASTSNFLLDGGRVADIAWLFALSLVLALLLGFLGAVSVAVYRSWPHPPAWTMAPLRTAPLTSTPGRRSRGPSWGLSAAVVTAGVFTLGIALMAETGEGVVAELDAPVSDWFAESEALDRLGAIDLFGSTIFSMVLAGLIGLSAFRCRVMALAYPLAFAVSWNTTMFLRDVVDRQRPTGVGLATSFPSGHMVQAVFIAGLLPLALGVLLSDRRLVVLTRAALGAAVVLTAIDRIHRLKHWPIDALGGVALGLTVVLAVHWALEHRSWHRSCSSCPWSAHPHHVRWDAGVFALSDVTTRRVGHLAVFTAVAASASLLAATLVIGLPSDPEGEGFGSAVIEPVQIGFAALIGVAGLLALRYKATASVLMVLGAVMLGLAASVQYKPYVAMLLAMLLLVPAVLTWLAWQPRETLGTIARLAVFTALVLTLTGFGTVEIYGFYFGPTHPESSVTALDSDAAWLWLGNVDSTSATIVAGGLPPASQAVIRVWQADSEFGDGLSIAASTDVMGLARFEVPGLSADTDYRYLVEDDLQDKVEEDDLAASVTFRTHDVGPQNLVIALGSCARRGSNGAVYDAIVSEDPDLYLALGDLHYGNITSTDPADHVREYALSIGQPGQSSLFRSVPTAYVWDDHDYGPNDSGADSPARDAVSEAYRAAVPHAGASADVADSIAHAFTVGRVRVVMTDTRSHRSESTMLGMEQLDWLIDEITVSSTTHALVIWANPTPWISAPGTSADDWSAFAEERRLIADAIADAGVANLIMVSGDAHMLAIDDGTNSGYATDGSPGFPVFHAAALDRPGSVKGGPYSEGTFSGGGQYGRLEIVDDGGSVIDVRMSGHTWDGEMLIEWSDSYPVPSGAIPTPEG